MNIGNTIKHTIDGYIEEENRYYNMSNHDKFKFRNKYAIRLNNEIISYIGDECKYSTTYKYKVREYKSGIKPLDSNIFKRHRSENDNPIKYLFNLINAYIFQFNYDYIEQSDPSDEDILISMKNKEDLEKYIYIFTYISLNLYKDKKLELYISFLPSIIIELLPLKKNIGKVIISKLFKKIIEDVRKNECNITNIKSYCKIKEACNNKFCYIAVLKHILDDIKKKSLVKESIDSLKKLQNLANTELKNNNNKIIVNLATKKKNNIVKELKDITEEYATYNKKAKEKYIENEKKKYEEWNAYNKEKKDYEKKWLGKMQFIIDKRSGKIKRPTISENYRKPTPVDSEIYTKNIKKKILNKFSKNELNTKSNNLTKLIAKIEFKKNHNIYVDNENISIKDIKEIIKKYRKINSNNNNNNTISTASTNTTKDISEIIKKYPKINNNNNNNNNRSIASTNTTSTTSTNIVSLV